jgi:hypothetical protein
MRNPSARKWFFLLEPKAVLFGCTLFIFICMWVKDARVDWTGSAHYHGYFANVNLSFPLAVGVCGVVGEQMVEFASCNIFERSSN